MFSAAGKSAVTSSGYNINNSLRFRRSATAFLNRTPASASNRKTFTYSAWIKRGLSGNNNFFCVNPNTGYSLFALNFDLNVSGDIGVYQNTGGTNILVVSTNALFRDFAAWYHIVVAIDTTQATPANRVLIYVNGVSQSLTISTQVALNTDLYVNNTLPHTIGKEQTASGGSVNYFDGYMAEINFIDGQALTPSSFGETDGTTGVWKPKKFGGSFGTNGFYLPFSDIATTSGSNAGLGKDFSGNSNYWTTNNISVTAGTTYDAMIDSPTLTSATVANYAVLNPLQSAVAPTAGNLDFNSGAGEVCPKATIQLPLTGKWYWETYCSATGTDNWIGVTIDQTGTTFGSGTSYRAYRKTGVKESNGTTLSYGASWAAGDTLGVAVDMDAGTIVFYKNGASQGTAYSDLAGIQWTVFVYGYINAGHQVNFGQRPFLYTPPTGHVALNTYNLPDSTIKKGSSYMNVATYTGSSSNVTVTSGFYPDFAWAKSRNNTYNHSLFDSVRGGDNVIFSNLTNAESTTSGLATFSSTGVTWLTGAGGINADASTTYVNWFWNAGSGTTTVNTSGNTSSNVSVNATAGFSIVTYTVNTTAGMTIGHGLGVVPKMILEKRRDNSANWDVYHASLGNTGRLLLNTSGAFDTQAGVWNNTTPTSTVFSQQGNGNWHAVGSTCVAYCFAEIAGFSKFTTYTGNGSTDGPFVYLGFRPKFVMVKGNVAGVDWAISDSTRNTYNVVNARLQASLTNAEDTGDSWCDFLSNGFKIRSTNTNQNYNGYTFIVMAFAENPFKNSLAR